LKYLDQLHGFIIRHGLESHRTLNFKLQRSYSSLGHVEKSVVLFNHTRNRDIYLYSSLIHGHAINGLLGDALRFYVQMLGEYIEANAFTISGVLKACSTLESGAALHCHAYKFGFQTNAYVTASLVDVYARGGNVVSARMIFDRMEERDVVSWNVMIDGYAQHGRPSEALILFRNMLKSRFRPNEATMVAALSACGQVGSLESGKWIHSYLGSTSCSGNAQLATALIDMYCKCGSIHDARKVFDGIRNKDVVCYNAMMGGYSLHGQGEEALNLFNQMLETGLRPTDITFISVLNACAHSGFISEGQALFSSMKDDHGIRPKVEHYGCMVHLLGKNGKLNQAWDMVMNMDTDPDSVVWVTLLDSCRLHKNVAMAEKVTEYLKHHRIAVADDPGMHVLLSGIYAAAGMSDDVAETRAKMKRAGLRKQPGCSCIDVNGVVEEFVAGDVKHPMSREIYETLDSIN
ncbi:hypothetical protein M569_07673, partial [Genlisea aurea]